jgi:uncharacterized membrane protein YccC
MAIFEHLPDKLRGLFDEGLDEVLIFAIIFIIILVSGADTADNLGLMPLVVIAVFLFLFVGLSRNEDNAA